MFVQTRTVILTLIICDYTNLSFIWSSMYLQIHSHDVMFKILYIRRVWCAYICNIYYCFKQDVPAVHAFFFTLWFQKFEARNYKSFVPFTFCQKWRTLMKSRSNWPMYTVDVLPALVVEFNHECLYSVWLQKNAIVKNMIFGRFLWALHRWPFVQLVQMQVSCPRKTFPFQKSTSSMYSHRHFAEQYPRYTY